MLEGVLERLLLKLFGDYVQEFNRDQLHVSMYVLRPHTGTVHGANKQRD
jgi:hypothetical protein